MGGLNRKSIHEWERFYHLKVLNIHPGKKNRKLDRKELINFLKKEAIQLTVDSYNTGEDFIQRLI